MIRTIILAALCNSVSPAFAGGVDLVSQVDNLMVVALDHLPSNPAGPVDPTDCTPVVVNPRTPEGQGIAQKGWGVTSEIVLNGLSIVSFAGHVSPGTSGSCEITDGNIAIFRAGRMEGLIYAEPNSRRGIGSISETEGGLRVWDGSYPYRPWADLRLHGPDLVIVIWSSSRLSPVATRFAMEQSAFRISTTFQSTLPAVCCWRKVGCPNLLRD